MTKENRQYSLSPNVRRIIVDSIRAVAGVYTMERPKKGLPNLASVRAEYRSSVLKGAACVADMEVLEDLNRGGLTKEEEIELFQHTERIRNLAKRLETRRTLNSSS